MQSIICSNKLHKNKKKNKPGGIKAGVLKLWHHHDPLEGLLNTDC